MNNNKLFFLFPAIALLFLAGLSAFSQTKGEDYSELFGKVTDGRSGKALPFSSVSLSSSAISNVTNADGFFTLKIPASALNPESSFLRVSFVGYSAVNVPLTSFQGSSREKPFAISLERVSLELLPSMVKPYDAKGLFDEAFRRVKDNYSVENISMTGFYRERILKGSKYLAMNEAVVDILKTPYTSSREDKIGIFKGRGSVNYDSSDTLFVKLQGGPVSALDFDIVKNPFLGVYLRDAHTSYDFYLSERAYMNDRTFYVVSFKPKEIMAGKEILFRGRVYIDTASFAIGRFDVYENVENNPKASELFIKNKPSSLKVMIDEAHYIINYKIAEDGKWYLDYENLSLSFTAKKKRSLFKNRFTAASEMAVTDHKSGSFAISPESRLRGKDVLSEKVSSFTDDNFWGGYNIIEPDKSIDKIVEKIVKQLKKREEEK